MPKRCFMPPEWAAELLFADPPEVDLLQERLDERLARPAIGDALEQGEVLEQLLGADLRVEAELLRQVAQRLAHGVLLVQHVDVAERDSTLVRLLQRGKDAHQRGLAGAVGAEKAEHAGRDREGHVLQRLHAVRISLGHVANLDFHGCRAPFP
jgi:hypothetical protein